MPWVAPRYSRTKIDAAGRILANPLALAQDYSDALTLVNNWRSSHGFPLNTLQNGLRQKAKQVVSDAIIAQRIKRLSSISRKLRDGSTRLSQMQDLGGCRAVVKTVPQVRRLLNLHLLSEMKHQLDHVDNYIENPRPSGYRSVHLVYRYHSDKNTTYNGLKIEVQLRSSLQHAWATAVETVGTFTEQALKASKGEAEWLRFFTLMGTAIANRERTTLVPNTPTDAMQLRDELRHHVTKLKVEDHLQAYGTSFDVIEEQAKAGAHYFLLQLDFSEKTVRVNSYSYAQLEDASADYLAAERSTGNRDAVLVSVDSVAALRRAYPNYFLDTSAFIETVKKAIA
ncbi:MAG TPA: RelA/SpoT domain-containing protein [Bryobacteraceae bacterium]|nr:RelA/SpoT domain-containing protein [Bryobacteraceae bacterium]